MNTTTRSDVKQLAATIEVLAKEFQLKMDSNIDFVGALSAANELVRNSQTFVFALGEVYALEQIGAQGKTVKATKVSSANRHNVRDTVTGRFTRKV